VATALSVLQSVALEINLPKPASVTDGGQDLAGRGFQLLKTAGRRLAKKDWPELVYEYEFTLIKDQPYYDMPDDYGRLVQGTGWDRVESRPLTTLNAQQWQEWKSGLVQAEVWKQYRVKGVEGARKIFINPTPSTTGNTFELVDGVEVPVGMVVEYYSTHWCESSTGVGKATPTAGTDVIRIPSEQLEAELKWRWLRSLSRPFADEKIEAEALCEQLLAQSGIPETLDAGLTTRGLSHPNIPETNVGLS
jgi:hypothetical protein